MPTILEIFVCTHKHVLHTHTHTHTGLPEQRLIFTQTNTHTHSVMLIRLLSQLHLGQTKHAATDDGVSTMAINFSAYLLSNNYHKSGRMPGLVESLVSHQTRPNHLLPFLISVSCQVPQSRPTSCHRENRNSLNTSAIKSCN